MVVGSVFYELWKHGGAAALIVFSAIMTTAGFMLLYLRCPGTRYWAAAATALGALTAAPSWGVRPQMFTFTLASLLLWLLESGEDRPRLLFWIPPLFLLWLNLHAGFALGPALLIAYGIGLIAETAVGSTPWQEARPILLRVLLLLLACRGPRASQPQRRATLSLSVRYSTLSRDAIVHRRVVLAGFSSNGCTAHSCVAWLLVLTALGSSRSRPKGRVLMPLLLTSFAALDAVRHIPIFVLVAIPVMAAALPAASASLAGSLPPHGLLALPRYFSTVPLSF